MVSRVLGRNNGLTKPFTRGQNLVDLMGCYSNFSALDELMAAVSE